MPLTLGELKAKVRARGYDTDLDDIIMELLNDAQRELIGEREWGFLEAEVTKTLVVASPEVFQNAGAVPADWRERGATHVHIVNPQDSADRWELEHVGTDELRDLMDSEPDRGAPERWAHGGTNGLLVHPIPDLAYTATVVYQQNVDEMTDDALDSSVIPDPDGGRILVAAALAELGMREHDYDQADRWAQVYQRKRAALIRHDSNRYRRDELRVGNTGIWDAYMIGR